ncbi:unnamed protein product [Prunus armeniaca]
MGEFDIQFKLRPAEKGHAIADFIFELTPSIASEPANPDAGEPGEQDAERFDPSVPLWILHVDGWANHKVVELVWC